MAGTIKLDGTTFLTKDSSNNFTLDVGSGGSISQGTIGSNVVFPEGVIIQVKTGTHSTETNTNNTGFVATGISVSITPKSSSSKIFIICNTSGYNAGGTSHVGYYTIYRDSTDISGGVGNGYADIYQGSGAGHDLGTNICISEVDSPNTASAITYEMRARSSSTSHNVYWSMNGSKSDITVMEIAG